MIKTILGTGAWLKRLPPQVHICLFWGAATFLPIAGRAGRYQVMPGVGPAPVSGNDVVNGQDPPFFATILARMLIAPKHFALRKGNPGAWSLDHVAKADNRRQLILGRTGANKATAVYQNFRFSGKNKTQCPFDIADIQRFKGCI